MSFRLIYEIEPPRVPDLKKVLTQIEIFGPITDAILVPDNHLGLAAMSSIAIALEVRNQGFKPIVALNARDRNHLRLQSDLITLSAYGIEEVLFLYGDPISEGRSELTVRKMLKHDVPEGVKRGVAVEIGKGLGWKSDGDFFFTQLAFGRKNPGYWRESKGFSQPLFCGVIALPNGELARKFTNNIPGLEVPEGYFEAFEKNEEAGFEAALNEMDQLVSSGVDGAHLVVPARWRRFAELLEEWATSKHLR